MTAVVVVVIVAFLIFAVVAVIHDQKKGILPSPRAAVQAQATQQARLVCPHCHTTGRVRAKPVKVKRGISGGKATGAVLTGGISMLGTGLSRKEKMTEMRCGNCGTTWHV